MTNSECATCVWERATGAKVDTSQSKTAWGRIVGVSEASIRRHLAHPATDLAPTISDRDLPDILKDYDIPAEVITSMGLSLRDPDTGSWTKVNWKPNAKALHDVSKYDDLKDALDNWDVELPELEVWDKTPETLVVNAADFQVGKAMQRGGGTRELVQRTHKAFAQLAEELSQAGGIYQIVLVDNGDPIENCWNTPAQLVTNDLPVPEQIRVFRRLMLEGIKILAPLCASLVYVSVPSNHGAARVGYKAAGGTVDADFGLEISHQLEDAVRMSEALDHVTFVRPESLEETAVLETADGTKLAFHHGHQAAGPGGQGKWWAAMDHGRMPGWDADILVTAHYHSLALEHSGNGRWIIRCSSSDVGSDWFTNRTGEHAVAGMTVFNVNKGQWSDLRIV